VPHLTQPTQNSLFLRKSFVLQHSPQRCNRPERKIKIKNKRFFRQKMQLIKNEKGEKS
jgi:hypothetical protein